MAPWHIMNVAIVDLSEEAERSEVMRPAVQKDFIHALRAVDFPAPRDRILSAAKDTGGLNEQVLLILEQIPNRTYESSSDLADEIERAEPPMTVDGDVQSADESGIAGATKDLIAEAADPKAGSPASGEEPAT
jgi:hypothetical protein